MSGRGRSSHGRERGAGPERRSDDAGHDPASAHGDGEQRRPAPGVTSGGGAQEGHDVEVVVRHDGDLADVRALRLGEREAGDEVVFGWGGVEVVAGAHNAGAVGVRGDDGGGGAGTVALDVHEVGARGGQVRDVLGVGVLGDRRLAALGIGPQRGEDGTVARGGAQAGQDIAHDDRVVPGGEVVDAPLQAVGAGGQRGLGLGEDSIGVRARQRHDDDRARRGEPRAADDDLGLSHVPSSRWHPTVAALPSADRPIGRWEGPRRDAARDCSSSGRAADARLADGGYIPTLVGGCAAVPGAGADLWARRWARRDSNPQPADAPGEGADLRARRWAGRDFEPPTC